MCFFFFYFSFLLCGCLSLGLCSRESHGSRKSWAEASPFCGKPLDVNAPRTKPSVQEVMRAKDLVSWDWGAEFLTKERFCISRKKTQRGHVSACIETFLVFVKLSCKWQTEEDVCHYVPPKDLPRFSAIGQTGCVSGSLAPTSIKLQCLPCEKRNG